MLNGFRVENFDKGVAMIPKPVSEAWFLCAIYRKKKGPQYNCDYLEDETFGTAKDHQLKGVLEAELGDVPTISLLNQKIACGDIDFQHLNLPSFNHFKKSLNAAT